MSLTRQQADEVTAWVTQEVLYRPMNQFREGQVIEIRLAEGGGRVRAVVRELDFRTATVKLDLQTGVPAASSAGVAFWETIASIVSQS